MNNNNFFKKHLATIVITFLIGSAIIGFYQGRNEPKKEKEELFLTKEEIDNYDSKFNSSRPKRETEKPKCIITKARFEQIKSYVFGENNNQTLLLNDLSKIEKNEIEKIKNSWKSSLNFLKDEQDTINEENKKCNDLRKQPQLLYSQIEKLKQQLKQKEQEKTKEEEKEIAKKEEKEKLVSPYDKIKLKAEIEKIQDEVIELVCQISNIKSDIGCLETDQKMYESMLSNAENFKKLLAECYKDFETQCKNDILTKLNSLYEIPSAEE